MEKLKNFFERAFGPIKELVMMKAPTTGSVWQHYKGGYYEVTGIGKHSETQEDMVAYVDADGQLWFRPLSMWHDQIENDDYKGPRFLDLGVRNGSVKPIFTTPAFKARATEKRRGF